MLFVLRNGGGCVFVFFCFQNTRLMSPPFYADDRTVRLLTSYGVALRDDWTHDLPAGRTAPPSCIDDRVSFEMTVKHIANVLGGRTLQTVRHLTAPRLSQVYDARPPVKTLRSHQQLALERTIIIATDGSRTVRSGLWIMPCGSGKTLTGVQAAKMVGRTALVVVPNTETAVQWEREFHAAGVASVVHLAEETPYGRALLDIERYPVLILTWKALALHAACGKTTSARLVCALNLRVHDLVLLDEVHLLPADTHKRALDSLRVGSVIGMTAEPVRCDGRHSELLQDVGDVLYRMTLEQSLEGGITVDVQRIVMCVHTDAELLSAYEASTDADQRRLLALFNPQKLCVLDSLLKAETGNKVIVYCDKLRAIPIIEGIMETLGTAHSIPFLGTLSGEKSSAHRRALCDNLRQCTTGCALLTRAGSTSIDVTDIDCVIELDVCDASLGKNVQRGGRAQRVHPDKYNARFVTLVSQKTREEHFAQRRVQQSTTHQTTRTVPIQSTDGIASYGLSCLTSLHVVQLVAGLPKGPTLLPTKAKSSRKKKRKLPTRC